MCVCVYDCTPSPVSGQLDGDEDGDEGIGT